eukprot:CAMPEP_0182450234 /NCGR_PEP_ID=MMETSP1172-20130603/39893_1 /TAXON_ID=708627 /ORGANISM="Timspurckia oligopyrenoides, Strain CCMP3278" /LENGTH=254 /DNA_ID=CAMNT_0024647771 /DNA_START=365 /DNA_END=1129 /DNA_ORIENTATION=-
MIAERSAHPFPNRPRRFTGSRRRRGNQSDYSRKIVQFQANLLGLSWWQISGTTSRKCANNGHDVLGVDEHHGIGYSDYHLYKKFTMGSVTSKLEQQKQSLADSIKANVEEDITRRMMLQREVQMAVNIAMARDTIYIFGSLWLTLVSGLTIAKLMKKPVPIFAGIPVVMGAITLGNLADMAYGTKMARVMKEAAHLMDNEKPRFVPMPQAPFARFYTAEDRSMFYDTATAVGDLAPYSAITRWFVPKSKPSMSE